MALRPPLVRWLLWVEEHSGVRVDTGGLLAGRQRHGRPRCAGLIQRCRRHKERNVTDDLPGAERPLVQRRLGAAWALGDADQAHAELAQLARSLDRKRPGAAASLREGRSGP
jgi:hypothetical protein